MKTHPLADVFPAMSEEEFSRLADSIEREGLIDAITLLGGGGSRRPPPSKGAKTNQSLREALKPLRNYLKNWNDERLYGMPPQEARHLLKQVQEVDAVLFEVERALEARTITSRALR